MWVRIAALAALLVCSILASAQTIARAYAGPDGKAHIVFANGVTKTIAAEDQQVGCDNVQVAPDRRTVGWTVLYGNCCTSYPIPTAVGGFSQSQKVLHLFLTDGR